MCIYNSCKNEVYEGGQKCIFHCDKDHQNGWITSVHSNTHEGKKSKWNQNKVKIFWQKFKTDIEKGVINVEGYQLPIYWPLHYPDINILDIQFENIEFRECKFLDYFILEDKRNIRRKELNHESLYTLTIDGKESSVSKQKKLQNDFSLEFNRCHFYDKLKLDTLSLKRLCLLDNKHENCIELNKLNISEESEICRTIGVIDIEIYDTTTKKSFEIWHNEATTVNIRGGEYTELIIKRNRLDELTLENVKLKKMKIQEQYKEKAQDNYSIKLHNLDFEENSRILFENISCDSFELTKLSQDSKFIQFDHITVNEKLILSQNEFKNTYFNDFEISNATKKIEKTSFIDASLNLIKWGKIFQIEASQDIFRQLKLVNDIQENYIDANNFYVMEMKKYQEKLNKEKWRSAYWQEKLVFLLGEKISNHGQSWFLPLLWLILTSLGFYTIASLLKINDNITNLQAIGLFILIVWMSTFIFYIDTILPKFKDFFKDTNYIFRHLFSIILLLIYSFCYNLGDTNTFVKFIGLKISEEFETVLIWWLLNKITMSFLFYHFIIALRRQTKR